MPNEVANQVHKLYQLASVSHIGGGVRRCSSDRRYG